MVNQGFHGLTKFMQLITSLWMAAICLPLISLPARGQEVAAPGSVNTPEASTAQTQPPAEDIPVYTPLTESQAHVSLGSGLQRVPHRFQLAAGGGSTFSFGRGSGTSGAMILRDQGTQAVGSVRGEFDVRHARLTLELQAGNPVLRIAGQAQVLPLSLILRAPVERTTNATYINLQLIPLTVQGHVFIEELTRGDISISPEIAFQITNVNAGNIAVGGMTFASARLGAGAAFGTTLEPGRAAQGREQTNLVAAPYVSAAGRLNINLVGALGLEMNMEGRLTHDVQEALTMWQAGASVGAFYGLPFGLRGIVRLEAQFQGAAWEPRRGSTSTDSTHDADTTGAIDGYGGMAAALAF